LEPIPGSPVVILVRPQLAENIGTAARAMANGGLFHLRLVAPRDGWPQERAWRTASGADRILDTAVVYPDVAAATADLHRVFATCPRPRHIIKPVLTARGAAAELRTVCARGLEAGILFGPERAGLDNDDMAEADAHFRRAADLVTARAAAGASPAPAGQPGCVVSRPAGVAGLMTSWRTPFLAQARPLAPALAAGCTVVLKPDEWAPLPAMLLAEITAAAGLPAGVLNVVHCSRHHRAPGTQARDGLIEHPAVTRLWFAGDAADGLQVTADVAAQHKPLQLELAGTSPCLIFADADLDQAADAVLFGAFALNGQRATATSAVLAERPVYDELVSRLAKRAKRIPVGAPSDPSTQIVPLVHAEQHSKVSASVRAAVRDGALMAAGGMRPRGLPVGNYFEATMLSDVTPSMQIFAEHVCGPVVRVTPFDTEEEALSLASAIKDAPTTYLWTSDLQRAHRIAPTLETADIWVNPRDLRAPSAGPGTSQPGAPEGLSVEFYLQSRTLHSDPD
ncbi:MAG: aldehyde dehydrogenase family protein, partial [Streptosporangiaceae bacterium]